MDLPSATTTEQQMRIRAVVQAATAWRDPEHPARAEAVDKTLEVPNRFTEQALAFAINQQMGLITPSTLAEWVGAAWTETPRRVGVLNAGNVPLVGLQDLLAVLLTGHEYIGALSSKSPYLLPAFVEEMKQTHASLPAQFVETESLLQQAEALIATGGDDTIDWVREQCDAHEIPEDRRLVRGHRYSVAVIDGNESEEERENLAEDALLHEGYGCRNVAIIWAPRDLEPDPYLNAFARFRGMFPVHPDLPGALQMPQALLEATGQSHAYGEGMEFLVSRGEPEPQQPGHVRWAEYDALEAVNTWLDAHASEVQLVVARPDVIAKLSADVPVLPLGAAQRPALDWQPDRKDTVAFLESLG